MVKYLGAIDASKAIVERLPIPFGIEQELCHVASVKMSHYSTKIEGNRLTLKQTEELLSGKDILAREIDKKEVMNYYDCLEFIQRVAKAKKPLTGELIQEMHSIIEKGILKGKLRGHYREAQNAIFDSHTRKPVYFPPETKDVKPFMEDFVAWLNQKNELHPALKAGIAHYRFVVIHPFMDGNGRVARALATLILYLENYDLRKLYSLEEYYAEDLQGYYLALQNCHGPNYYDTPDPDITLWLEYFLKGVGIVFEEVRQKVEEATKQAVVTSKNEDDRKLLENIGPREKRVLGYFKKTTQLRRKNLCILFQIKDRSAGDLLKKWILMGLLERKGSGFRDAYYVLSENYRRLIED